LSVRWIDQRRPFQRSANVVSPAGRLAFPTAVHEAAEVHETPPSCAPACGLGVG
jgi:hypothetical protein